MELVCGAWALVVVLVLAVALAMVALGGRVAVAWDQLLAVALAVVLWVLVGRRVSVLVRNWMVVACRGRGREARRRVCGVG